MTCFHTAIVAEPLTALPAPPTFRDLLVPLRDSALGSFVVEELVRVRIPVGRTTVLEPWEVTERVALRR